MNEIKNCYEMKFENYFKKHKKVIIIHEHDKKVVKNYREFLESFLSDPYDTLDELEEFLISFIKFIAIFNNVEIELFYNSNGAKKEKNTQTIKRIYLDDFESIINTIEELNIARVLTVH